MSRECSCVGDLICMHVHMCVYFHGSTQTLSFFFLFFIFLLARIPDLELSPWKIIPFVYCRKKKRAWPSCYCSNCSCAYCSSCSCTYCSNCSWAFCYSKCPSCYCLNCSRACCYPCNCRQKTWSSCQCLNCSWAFCYPCNCRQKRKRSDLIFNHVCMFFSI